MNKAELSEKWGKYCDTNALVDDVRELLNTYHHRNTERGVCKMLNEFFTNKESLIKLITASNHYIGNLRIKTTQSFDRAINRGQIQDFFYEHGREFLTNKPKTSRDDDGKTMLDYLKVDARQMNLFDIVDNKALKEMCEKISQFRDDGFTYASFNWAEQCNRYIQFFKNICEPMLSVTFTPSFDAKAPVLKEGTKTSRAFGAFCRYYGFNKKENYNKIYAKYADLVSPLKRNMDFVISANPLDYLTMSNGVSWVSCHNIRDGSYKGGCMSYMLDCTSLITYVVEDISSNAKIHLIPKNYRQMIHYSDGLFMQNRLYPAENDGATNLHAKFRGFVEDEFAEILGVEGEWDVETGATACSGRVNSLGVHYKDYISGFRTHVFYPRTKANALKHNKMTVGHAGVCTYCGCEYSATNRLAHDRC